jgi:hypothetical protein
MTRERVAPDGREMGGGRRRRSASHGWWSRPAELGLGFREPPMFAGPRRRERGRGRQRTSGGGGSPGGGGEAAW